MPRINEERTRELHAWQAHERYLEEHYKGRSINEGWCQDFEAGIIASKVYGDDPRVVTTSMFSPYETRDDPYG